MDSLDGWTERIRRSIKDKKIAEAVVEYASKTKQLDEVLTELTKSICAERCSDGYGSCCHTTYYDASIPSPMVKLQKMEAGESGLEKGDSECRYHSETGCHLTLFKSPICIGYLCLSLKNRINSIGNEEVYDFLCEMDEIKLMFAADPEILPHMDKAIEIGQRLVQAKYKQQP